MERLERVIKDLSASSYKSLLLSGALYPVAGVLSIAEEHATAVVDSPPARVSPLSEEIAT